MFEGHPDAASRLSKSIENARKARAEKTAAAARGAEAVAAGRDLTADEAGQGAIDALWKAEKGADPTQGSARAIEIARRTQILPTEAREQIVDGLIFGTPEKRAEQARALVELIKAAPAAAGTLPPELRQEATRIAKRLEQGHTPESATEGTDKALEEVGDAVLAGGAGDDTLEAQADGAVPAESVAAELATATDENPFATLDGVQVAGLETVLTRLLQALGRAPKRPLPALKGRSVPPKPENSVPPKAEMPPTPKPENSVPPKAEMPPTPKPEARAPINIEKPTPRPPFSGVPREVLDTAKATGDHIREKLGLAARRLGEGATLLPLEPIADMALKRFQDMAKEGKYKAEFTPEDFGEGLSPSDAIHAFAEAEMNGTLRPAGGQHVAQLNLGEVSPALAEKVKRKTDLDISKLHHTMDNIQLGHTFGRHGPGNEESADQVPVTFEALSGYLKALDTCEEDDIDGPRLKDVGPTFTCTKKINGVLYIVEQVRTAKGELAFFDMWIKKNEGDKK
jgi:hypothetical protein